MELLPASQDHKRLLEGDAGPNTGGMGAYSPVSVATPELLDRARREVLLPTLAEMRRRGTPFTGVLYAGLMMDDEGTPWVVEFNCRLGDPETQVVLPLVADGLHPSRSGRSPRGALRLRSIGTGRRSVTTVLAPAGYPERPRRAPRSGSPDRLPEGVTVFHAGTAARRTACSG